MLAVVVGVAVMRVNGVGVVRNSSGSRENRVGESPAARGSAGVAELAKRPGVVIEGFVPDLADVYATAELVVAPIFSGSGTKVKVLEALSHGLPVVTTPEGIAGLDGMCGHHAKLYHTAGPLSSHAVCFFSA